MLFSQGSEKISSYLCDEIPSGYTMETSMLNLTTKHSRIFTYAFTNLGIHTCKLANSRVPVGKCDYVVARPSGSRHGLEACALES